MRSGTPPEVQKNRDPSQWLRTQFAIELVELITSITCGAHIIETHRGRWGGTWVIPNLAIAYAKYLSPHFHAWANLAVIERMEARAIPSSIRLGSYVPYLSPKYLCRPDLDALI